MLSTAERTGKSRVKKPSTGMKIGKTMQPRNSKLLSPISRSTSKIAERIPRTEDCFQSNPRQTTFSDLSAFATASEAKAKTGLKAIKTTNLVNLNPSQTVSSQNTPSTVTSSPSTNQPNNELSRESATSSMSHIRALSETDSSPLPTASMVAAVPTKAIPYQCRNWLFRMKANDPAYWRKLMMNCRNWESVFMPSKLRPSCWNVFVASTHTSSRRMIFVYASTFHRDWRERHAQHCTGRCCSRPPSHRFR